MLINPPWYRFFGKAFTAYPIGLCYIASVLEKHGFDASVYNSDYNRDKLGEAILGDIIEDETYDRYVHVLNDINHPLWDEIERVIVRQSPDIVGIAAMTGQYGSALNIAKIAKMRDIPVVLGGVHPTTLPEETAREEEVDVVVRGEGEYTLLELASKIESSDLSDVLGITYREGNRIVHNPDRPLIQNLDDLPFPARHLLLEKETYPSGTFGKLSTTRGCPYGCTFCASNMIWGGKVRYRSAESIIEEIMHVQRTYGTCFFYFDDADFLINKRLVLRICELLNEEGLAISWGCEARPDEINDELAEKMMLAGCNMICIGVESGDDETLRRIRKGTTVEQIRKARRILEENCIAFYAFFMIGFPWETKGGIEKTVSFMRELDPDVASFTIVTPYPGTELYDACKEEGVIPQNINWRYFLHQRPVLDINRNLTRDEASQVVKHTNETFDRHNKMKMRSIIRSII